MDYIIAAWTALTLIVIVGAFFANHNAEKRAERSFDEHVKQALALTDRPHTN